MNAAASATGQRVHRGVRLVAAGLVAGLAACTAPSSPPPPGGGRTLDLDVPYFEVHVERVLGERGCARTTGCHGGQGAGMLLLSGGHNPSADYIAVTPHTRPWDPPSSPLLLKPLARAAGGGVHGGGEIFADTTDAGYQTIRNWIEGARLEPVSGSIIQ
jgi:hypothetical protein